MSFVDRGALKRMSEVLQERKAPSAVRTFVMGASNGVYVSITHRVAPDSPMTPSQSQWESASILFSALLSPQGSVKEAKLYEHPGIIGVEVNGYVSADEMDRINQEQLAKFREEVLLNK